MANWFMKEPCIHCPFRRDVRPFLRVERAEEIAGTALNKYSDFACHKTLGHDDDEGDTIIVATSLTCAGFLTMQINEAEAEIPEGFTPSTEVYQDYYEMVEAYEAEEAGEWEKP
jgi:hypothetical protein